MKRLLTINQGLDSGGELELFNDRRSGRLFWGTLLDFADAEQVTEISYAPDADDMCISIVIGGETLAMIPLPAEVRPLFLKYGQEIVLGRIWYWIFRWLGERALSFQRANYLIVEACGRRSEWKVECARDSIHFNRVAGTGTAA